MGINQIYKLSSIEVCDPSVQDGRLLVTLQGEGIEETLPMNKAKVHRLLQDYPQMVVIGQPTRAKVLKTRISDLTSQGILGRFLGIKNPYTKIELSLVERVRCVFLHFLNMLTEMLFSWTISDFKKNLLEGNTKGAEEAIRWGARVYLDEMDIIQLAQNKKIDLLQFYVSQIDIKSDNPARRAYLLARDTLATQKAEQTILLRVLPYGQVPSSDPINQGLEDFRPFHQ